MFPGVLERSLRTTVLNCHRRQCPSSGDWGVAILSSDAGKMSLSRNAFRRSQVQIREKRAADLTWFQQLTGDPFKKRSLIFFQCTNISGASRAFWPVRCRGTERCTSLLTKISAFSREDSKPAALQCLLEQQQQQQQQ